jgi:uncharacterized protein YdaL
MRKTNLLFILSLGFLVAAVTFRSGVRAGETKCVRIYFDKTAEPTYWMGKTYSMLLQNLLGHFPDYQQLVSPIESYHEGDIEKCNATFYIGSYFNNAIPRSFYSDYEKTNKRVAWIGYGIWKFSPESLGRIFGYHYAGLTTLDTVERDSKGLPTFFKNIHYKGETFSKYGKYSKDAPTQFLAAFEMTRLEPLSIEQGQASGPSEPTKILATAEHNGNGEQLPYILQNKNHFYFSDIPFSYMHEADRYLVFADVLFDVLGEKPQREGHLAFLRIEDVHPLVPLAYLYSITKALIAENIPIHISLIPIFYDPLGEYTRSASQEFVPLTRVPEFMQFLTEMKTRKAVMIWHGSTHQLGQLRNPFSAVSGDDFEFWDAKHGSILAQDSSDFALDRLETGYYDLQKADIFPQFWLTPHYQASPIDYLVFAHTIPWNVGRIIYFNHTVEKPKTAIADEELWFNRQNVGPATTQKRRDYFRQFKVKINDSHWSGQIFPYEIYGDVYGQRLIPEDLGNSQPTANEFVVQPRTTEQMLADAKRNLVLRDAWGSFFYHPQLLSVQADGGEGRFPGDATELLKLIQGMKALGYKFISIEDFAGQNQRPVRPEPIYVQ